MNFELTTAVTLLKTLTLLVGGLITYHSYTAYRRTSSPALRALVVGFGIVTLGAFLAGIVDQLIPVDPSAALVVESLFTTVGFAAILYSLYAD